MDQLEVQRFATEYRQASAEKLAWLLTEKDTLVPEAQCALVDIIASHPAAASIKAQAATIVEENRSAKSARPSLGFWLGCLTFYFSVTPIRLAAMTIAGFSNAEQKAPSLVEAANWQTYKWFNGALCIAVLLGAAIGVDGVLAGRNRTQLDRVLVALWFVSLSDYVLQLFTAAYFSPASAWAMIVSVPSAISLVIHLIVPSLWTAYLTTSDRCRQRYPRLSVTAAS